MIRPAGTSFGNASRQCCIDFVRILLDLMTCGDNISIDMNMIRVCKLVRDNFRILLQDINFCEMKIIHRPDWN
jgi:hypothetical protein